MRLPWASSVGLQEGTNRIVRALTQIRANGRLLGDEIGQISDLGIPIRPIIQEQFGMSSTELQEQSQSGKIGIDKLMAGILKGLEKTFGGNLLEQSTTLQGQLDNLAKKYKNFSMDLAKPLFEPLRDSLAALNEAADSESINELRDALIGVSKEIGPFIDKLNIIARLTVAGAGGVRNVAETAGGIAGKGLVSTTANTVSLIAQAAQVAGMADKATGRVASFGAKSLAAGAYGASQLIPQVAMLRGTDAAITSSVSAINSGAEYIGKSQPMSQSVKIQTAQEKREQRQRAEATAKQMLQESYSADPVGGAEKLANAPIEWKVGALPPLPDGFVRKSQANQFKPGDFVGPEVPDGFVRRPQANVINEPADADREARERFEYLNEKRKIDERNAALSGEFTPFKQSIDGQEVVTDPEKFGFSDKLKEEIKFAFGSDPNDDVDERFERTLAVGKLPPGLAKMFDGKTEEERKALLDSKFSIEQERDKEGNMVNRMKLADLGEMRPMQASQKTDFANLNTLVQGNLDSVRQREHKETLQKLEDSTFWLKKIFDKPAGETGLPP